MSPSGNFQEKLEKLKAEYAELLPSRLKEVDQAWHDVRVNTNPESLKVLRTRVHTLAGSGATFGFPELSAAASSAEESVDMVIEGQSLSDLQADIEQRLSNLWEAAKLETHRNQSLKTPNHTEAAFKDVELGHNLYWLGDDKGYATNMAHQLERFRYSVTYFNHVDDLIHACQEKPPCTVIFDGGEAGHPFPELEAFNQRCQELSVPVVCLCPPGGGMESWLRMVRAGAASCMTRPISMTPLLEKLEPHTFHWKEDPYHLFIIDDDETLAENMASILTKAGMVVKVETNPLNVGRALSDFFPDLILVDLYMPDFNGLDVSRLIRQDTRYLTVPIVYLSAEREVNQRLAALEAGADDFILKPVKLRYLYHALSSRIKRARQMRFYTDRDGLTGLLNHTAFQEELRRLLWSAIDDHSELVTALVDLDRFKAINDHHGHRLGDRLLRTLAIMLKRRFGSKALMGRYDGSVLVLAFPGPALKEVLKELNETRQAFSEVVHEAGQQLFEASFSAGLSHYPSFGNATELLDACQKALLEAKGLGRNRIEVEEPKRSKRVTERPAPPQNNEEGDDLFLLDDEGELLDDISLPPEEMPIIKPKSKKGGVIVVVDDDKQLLSVISSYLSSEGYEVYSAPTGDEGFDLILKHRPSVVLIDLLLFPGIHGFELCKKVKTHSDLQGIKVVLMTAVYKDYRYQREGREAGGDAFLIKPLNFDELSSKIETLMTS